MKALSATVWKNFAVKPMRRLNKVSLPCAVKGVNTTDGHMWEFSRFLIKPYFVREAFSNTNRLQVQTDNLMNLTTTDESTFDMQMLLQRWVRKVSSLSIIADSLWIVPRHINQFSFWESIRCLLYPERANIAWFMIDFLRGLCLRLQMSKWVWLF